MAEQLLALPSFAKRFDYLLIAPQLARKMIGRTLAGEVSYAESEQSYTRRQLLKVEKDALKKKLKTARVQSEYVQQINQQLHAIINKKIHQQLADTPGVCESLLDWGDDTTVLFDVLATPSVTISKVEAVAAHIPWLIDELIRLVNRPRYRRRDARGNIIMVDTLKTALSYMGVDTLKQLLPGLVYKHTLAFSTEPFPLLSQTVWEYTLVAAQTADLIADRYKVDRYAAFTLPLVSELGRSAITRLYFNLFEQVHLDFLAHAQKAKLSGLHSALVQLLPDPKALITLLTEHSIPVTLNVLDYMAFKQLHYTAPVKQLTADLLLEETSPAAQLLQQSRYYAKYRMLKDNHLFVDNEANTFLTGCALPPSTRLTLDNTDLRQLQVLSDM
ncbi:HDOD domain-containing protein [Alteromonas gilva]|uniref:HDOD domain-containing protein n=1 Tax=Alteromonas gilva TaxID=2987522 RepID=A0ABT5L5F6_9ALTE|nr:HDOD domain-containing protein [Alteromonas gilva]MDC8832108.1 HDOD domain-containing protein [Alteromonas gilva]